MLHSNTWLAAIAFPIALSACAAPDSTGPKVSGGSIAVEADYQESLILEQQIADNRRVQDVAFAVMSRNADTCGDDTASKFGFLAFNNTVFPENRRNIPKQLWDLDERLKVMHVVPSSPADQAGIEVGSHLVSVDGKTPTDTKDANIWLRERLQGKSQVTLIVEQDRDYKKLAVNGLRSCSYPVLISQSPSTNAYTDGETIILDSGIVRLATSNDELAGVISHELAHINEKHRQMKQQNEIVGSVGGMVIDVAFAVVGVNTGGAFTSSMGQAGAQAFSQDFEREADYVGSYYVAKAGYDVSKSAEFWRKLALENPTNVRYAGTHPTSSERFIALNATAKEISQKLATQAPLKPNAPEKKAPPPRRLPST